MSDITYQALLNEQIKLYYLRSFRVDPEELVSLFTQILNTISQLCETPCHDEKILNKLLMELMHAQQRKDYVAIRDMLWYEIKPFFKTKTCD